MQALEDAGWARGVIGDLGEETQKTLKTRQDRPAHDAEDELTLSLGQLCVPRKVYIAKYSLWEMQTINEFENTVSVRF